MRNSRHNGHFGGPNGEQEELRDLLEELRGQIQHLTEHLTASPRKVEGRYLVTLNQCAALVNRSKRSLEKYVAHKRFPLPTPYIRGASGRPHEYLWSEMKAWLEKVYGRTFPDDPSFLQLF